MKKFRVGIIGFGVMGKNHFRVLSKMPSVSFVGIHDKFNEEFESSSYKLNELLKLNLDYCVISVPSDKHLSVYKKIVSQKIPCLIEKPLASNIQDGEEILKLSLKNSGMDSVGFIERYNPVYIKSKEIVDSKEFGYLIKISTTRNSPYPGRIQDIGVGLDLATHDLDLAQWLSSKKYKTLSAVKSTFISGPREDAISAVGLSSDGTIFEHSISWLYPYKQRKVEILGEKMLLEADSINRKITLYRINNERKLIRKPNRIINLKSTKEPLELEHIHFQKKLMNISSTTVSIQESLNNLKLIQSIIK
jgi:UDP-N-acetylglucosamine 3-dehydrogenase